MSTPLEIVQAIVALSSEDGATELAALNSTAIAAKLNELAAAAAELRPNVTVDPDQRAAYALVGEAATKLRTAHDTALAAETAAAGELSATDDTITAATAGLPTAAAPAAPAEPAAPAQPTADVPLAATTPVEELRPADPENTVVEDPAAHNEAQYGEVAAVLASGPPSLDALAAANPTPTLVGNGIKAASIEGLRPGQAATEEQIAREFEAQHRSLQILSTSRRNPNPLGSKHLIGKVDHDRNQRTVFAEDAENRGLTLDDMLAKATLGLISGHAPMMQSLKAAGGPCSQLESDFDVVLSGGDVVTSFISMLPSIVNNRRMSIYPWKIFSLADRPAGNFNIVTADEDTAGYGATEEDIPEGGVLEKGCVRIDCPDPTPLSFHAIYQCLTIGNFINISFPEYVRVWREFMRVHFQAAREEDAIATYMAAARIFDVTDDVFGANRDLFSVIARFVASLRSDRMAPNLPISLAFPSFTALELADDHQKQMFHNSEMTALQAIASKIPNLQIGFYNVSAGTATGGSPTVLPVLPRTAGTTTGLQTWPAQMRILAWPTGAVFQQKVGQLGFGLRETGMKTNDFSEFSEVLEATHVRGDVYALDTKLCPQGEAAGSSVVACEAGS